MFLSILQIHFLRDQVQTIFRNSNFKIQYFEKKDLFKTSKVKKSQNHVATNREVFWPISKLIKIRDLGMEIHFFMLRFKICIRGVSVVYPTK